MSAPPQDDDCPVAFYVVDLDWDLSDSLQVGQWLERVAAKHGRRIDDLSCVITNDAYLRQMNASHLGHDYETDILTFNYAEPDAPNIFGEMYVSLDRVRDNAPEYGATETDELHRVFAHGLLHLIGFNDETDEEEALMRQAEDEALALR